MTVQATTTGWTAANTAGQACTIMLPGGDAGRFRVYCIVATTNPGAGKTAPVPDDAAELSPDRMPVIPYRNLGGSAVVWVRAVDGPQLVLVSPSI
jgi:hypothetical protein